jgi:uncharacterized protein (TIGR04255 family)
MDQYFSDKYPLSNDFVDQPLQIQTDSGVMPVGQPQRRRVYSTGDLAWNIAISTSFVSIYCVCARNRKAYVGREDCIARLQDVVEVISKFISAFPISRIGYRYVDVIPFETIDSICELFQPESMGFVRGQQKSDMEIAAFSNDIVVKNDTFQDDTTVHAKCGILPPNAVIDPSIPPQPKKTWVVDLDASYNKTVNSGDIKVREIAKKLADADHKFFEDHIITDRFIETYK